MAGNTYRRQILATVITLGLFVVLLLILIAYSLVAASGALPSSQPAEVAAGKPAAAAPSQPTLPPGPSSADLVSEARSAPRAPAEVLSAFNKGGCAGCHTIPGIPGANGTIGPNLTEIGLNAPGRIAGSSGEEYIRQSILDPNAFIAPTCPAGACPEGVMLQSFAQQISPDELEIIVSYLSVLGTDQAVELRAAPSAPVELDAGLPPESVLDPFQPLPKEPAGEAKIALGKYLFFDPRLSANNSLSCASCHRPENAFSDGEALSRGYPSTKYFRNTPTLLNTAYAPRLYWDGRMAGSDMPTLVRDHIAEAHFMSNDGRLMVERLNQIPAYVALLNEAFGGEPSYGKVLNAVTAYVQSLNSSPAPYDRYLAGEKDALSDDAQAGLALFEGEANCLQCHTPPLFSDGAYHNTGVATDPQMFSDPERHVTFRRFFRTLGTPNYRNLREDVGLYALTLEEADWGKFRTPSLREVGRTGPYMHNGSLATLEDVVRFYNEGGGLDNTAGLKPLNLTGSEIAQLVAFLNSLSSDPIPV